MFSEDGHLGCPRGLEDLRTMNNSLNAKVMAQVNDCQEVAMLNSFAKECSEYQFKKCLQDRISDIASWQWVLEDLSKRLDEAIAALKYEHNALRVVVQRIQTEINGHSRERTRPGALCPSKDFVEAVIMEEYKFLREEKKKFETMITELDEQTARLQKTKKRIDTDLMNKRKALSVEESCASIDCNTLSETGNNMKRKKRRYLPLSRWQNRCASLKRAGINALSNSVISRQQVRGARVYLSIAAQGYASRVDAALRKRLHANTVKLQELEWQREEALRDVQALDEELITTEQNLLETIDQERVVEARLVDRTLKPTREVTRDQVDNKLRDELLRLKLSSKTLRTNMNRIVSLQNNLNDTMSQMDCCAEDIALVMRLDQDRISWRLGETMNCDSQTSPSVQPSSPIDSLNSSVLSHGNHLTVIIEDDEDDYPVDN